jgi:hypothetical protein
MQDAWITRFVLDLKHRVVESSHRERTLKAHERAITDVQTGGACQAATCRYGPNPPPGVRIVPHHEDAWARTGTTSLSTTVPLCEADHHHLHTGRTLLLRDGRRLTADGVVDPNQPVPEPPF